MGSHRGSHRRGHRRARRGRHRLGRWRLVTSHAYADGSPIRLLLDTPGLTGPPGVDGLFGVVDLGSPRPKATEFDVLSSAMARWRGCRHVVRDARGAALFTAEGRLDNRDELCNALDIPPTDRSALPDDGLMLAAYGRWGEECAERLLGDWSFAAWHPHERRLVLGRDQLGNTSLYYARVGDRLAFASHIRALLCLPWVPRRLNEIRLARLLVGARPEEDGSCTIYRDVYLLRPAHTLRATPEGHRPRCYWRLDSVAPLELDSEAAYAEALLEGLRTAIRSRLRSDGPIGATLSAGLDSSSITVLAAAELARGARRLTALTSVPAMESHWSTAPGRISNEAPLAALVARSAPNIDHVRVDASDVSPIAGLWAMLRVHGEPRHAAGNYFWLVSLLSEAARRDVEVLLTGQHGNFVMSWPGPRASWRTELRRKGFGRAVRAVAHHVAPAPAKRLSDWYRFRQSWTRLGQSPWRWHSAIRTSFAREVGVHAWSEVASPRANSREVRAAHLRRAWQAGSTWKQLGSAFGMGIRDPSADLRLVSLAFSVPDWLWQGPIDRWLFREATRGILPDEVRLNPQRGLQAADLVDRLRLHRAELDGALAEVEASPLARRCIDVPYCHRIAAAMDGPPDIVVSLAASSTLMRALGAGLFLAAFERTGTVE